jgi:hypothetical protein
VAPCARWAVSSFFGARVAVPRAFFFSDHPPDNRNAEHFGNHFLEHPESGHVLRLARQGLPIQPRPLVIASREGFSVQLALSQRSHSPITKSREPRTATTSLIMWPGRIFGRIYHCAMEHQEAERQEARAKEQQRIVEALRRRAFLPGAPGHGKMRPILYKLNEEGTSVPMKSGRRMRCSFGDATWRATTTGWLSAVCSSTPSKPVLSAIIQL